MPTEALPPGVGRTEPPAEAAGAARRPVPARDLLLAAHPVPAFAVAGLATALAAATGRGPAGWLLVGAAVLCGQLCIGWSNDVIDLRRDLAAARTDKPLARGALAPASATAAACCAGAACVPLSLACGSAAGAAHLGGVAAGLAYNARLKRTRWSWLPYALAFGLLPAFVTLSLPGRPWPAWWLVAAAALLGVGAHLTNVLPDIDADLAAGVRGLPQRLGRTRSRVLAAAALLAASGVLVLGPSGPAGPIGWAGLAGGCALTAAALARAGNPVSRAPFLLTVALSAADLLLLLLRGAALH
ncbi:UbiA family prenyltransferase [Kitasatospora viridis]|uniref:4-hydroxybenzoate polyprenyltransferase n=1 Tax=Kitasatospora viridis TaxID=281105 RepID=A0A561UNB7_9ACTN|nr:UbiA family prenyltransferase [Kitasatospora viridis]TWG00851.1 4-hydroxybenzoate polyprenyltransferase [Kitasatospora viridis]